MSTITVDEIIIDTSLSGLVCALTVRVTTMKSVAMAITCAAALLSASAANSSQEGELIDHMRKLQYFSHKLGLAIDSGNKDLQHFYAHEVEEQIEGASEIEQFDGIEVGKLMTHYLVPRFEGLEDAIKGGEPGPIDTAYDEMLDSCNQCHRASQRHYIKVERRKDNPYMQSFAQ